MTAPMAMWPSDWIFVLRAAVSINVRMKYLYDLQLVVPGLGIFLLH